MFSYLFPVGTQAQSMQAELICQHFKDFGRNPKDYDQIITGDLGSVGQRALLDLLKEKGYDMEGRHMDCGIEIYDGKAIPNDLEWGNESGWVGYYDNNNLEIAKKVAAEIGINQIKAEMLPTDKYEELEKIVNRRIGLINNYKLWDKRVEILLQCFEVQEPQRAFERA